MAELETFFLSWRKNKPHSLQVHHVSMFGYSRLLLRVISTFWIGFLASFSRLPNFLLSFLQVTVAAAAEDHQGNDEDNNSSTSSSSVNDGHHQ